MRTKPVLVAIALILMVFATLMADETIVAGQPPITMKAAHCHIRLIEFVLATRLTVAQKDSFLTAIKNECSQMPEADRNNFLSALELAGSMEEMDEAGHEAVKFVLKKDFEETAMSLPADPAAALYLQLQRELASPAIQLNEEIVTNQSFAALIEYLEFVASPDKPEKFSAETVATIKKLLEESFLKLSEEERSTLDDFELTWHMIRAGWQNSTNQAAKDAALKAMLATGIKGGSIDLTKLKACLASDIYGDLLDNAAELGFEPTEWTVGLKNQVW